MGILTHFVWLEMTKQSSSQKNFSSKVQLLLTQLHADGKFSPEKTSLSIGMGLSR